MKRRIKKIKKDIKNIAETIWIIMEMLLIFASFLITLGALGFLKEKIYFAIIFIAIIAFLTWGLEPLRRSIRKERYKPHWATQIPYFFVAGGAVGTSLMLLQERGVLYQAQLLEVLNTPKYAVDDFAGFVTEMYSIMVPFFLIVGLPVLIFILLTAGLVGLYRRLRFAGSKNSSIYYNGYDSIDVMLVFLSLSIVVGGGAFLSMTQGDAFNAYFNSEEGLAFSHSMLILFAGSPIIYHVKALFFGTDLLSGVDEPTSDKEE